MTAFRRMRLAVRSKMTGPSRLPARARPDVQPRLRRLVPQDIRQRPGAAGGAGGADGRDLVPVPARSGGRAGHRAGTPVVAADREGTSVRRSSRGVEKPQATSPSVLRTGPASVSVLPLTASAPRPTKTASTPGSFGTAPRRTPASARLDEVQPSSGPLPWRAVSHRIGLLAGVLQTPSRSSARHPDIRLGRPRRSARAVREVGSCRLSPYVSHIEGRDDPSMARDEPRVVVGLAVGPEASFSPALAAIAPPTTKSVLSNPRASPASQPSRLAYSEIVTFDFPTNGERPGKSVSST